MATQKSFQYPVAAGEPPWKVGWSHRIALEAKYRFRKPCSRRTSTVTLTPLRGFPRPLADDDFPLLFLVRDDLRLMPSFFKHYRAMGVTRFICVDDRSTDGSTEFLVEQRDADVYRSNVRYKDAARGKIWRELLFDSYGCDRWYLNVDSDEYFVYESLGRETVAAFAQRLLEQQIRRMPATLLDLYPASNLCDAEFNGGDDAMPWHVATHFDGAGYTGSFHDKGLTVRGGVRQRLTAQTEADLIKYPLIYWDRHCSLGKSIHKPLPGKYNFAPVMSCLLHCKIFSDFRERVAKLAAEGQHFYGSQHYQRLEEMLSNHQAINFLCEHSIPYCGPHDLISRGFLLPLAAARAAAA